MPEAVAQISRRVVRGLVLWRARGHEMQVDSGGCWRVPSRSQPGLAHRVSPDGDVCDCGDARYGLHRCAHGWAVLFEASLRTALAETHPDIRDTDDHHPPGGHTRGFGRRPR